MNEDCLKLTAYFGERAEANGVFLSDALCDIYERHALQTSVVMRGIEGFGVKHHVRTARLLSLSEDLPLVSVAVDTRPRIEAALAEVTGVVGHGLITLERAQMLTGRIASVRLPAALEQQVKLTVYCGRRELAGTDPAYLAVVDALYRAGVAGATVLLGVDGTAHGVRERGRFFSRNAEVPLMIIAVGERDVLAGSLPELESILRRPADHARARPRLQARRSAAGRTAPPAADRPVRPRRCGRS